MSGKRRKFFFDLFFVEGNIFFLFAGTGDTKDSLIARIIKDFFFECSCAVAYLDISFSCVDSDGDFVFLFLKDCFCSLGIDRILIDDVFVFV